MEQQLAKAIVDIIHRIQVVDSTGNQRIRFDVPLADGELSFDPLVVEFEDLCLCPFGGGLISVDNLKGIRGCIAFLIGRGNALSHNYTVGLDIPRKYHIVVSISTFCTKRRFNLSNGSFRSKYKYLVCSLLLSNAK